MKTRQGFVSNSSSSSFICAVPKDRQNSKIKIILEADLSTYADATLSSIEELMKYYLDDYGYDVDDLKDHEHYQAAKKAIENGKVILVGSFSDESYDDSVELALCNLGINNVQLEGDCEVIEGDGGY